MRPDRQTACQKESDRHSKSGSPGFTLRYVTASWKFPLQALVAYSAASIGIVQAQTAVGNDDDPVPYFIGGTASFTQDSNVFRESVHPVKDSYTSAGAVGGVDQSFGSQRFYALGNVQYNKFRRSTQLDNVSYRLNSGLEWVTLGSLSGALSANLNQSLANNSFTNQVALRDKNIQRIDQVRGSIVHGKDSYFPIELNVARQQVRYSAVEYKKYETSQTTAAALIKLSSSSVSSIGVGVRRTLSEYTASSSANGNDISLTRTDLDLVATWYASGKSTVDGRFSFGRQRREGAGQQDFSRKSGQVQWLYKPAAALVLNASLLRDTGLNSTFFNLNSGPEQALTSGDNSQLTTQLNLSAKDAVTAKISVFANVRFNHRSLNNTFDGSVSTVDKGNDAYRGIALGAAYTPTLQSTLGCNLSRDRRTVSQGTPLSLSYPYGVNTARCSVQLKL